MPDFSLDGQTALVTGASSGLGAHFAATLGAAGARVVLLARRADRLETLAAELAQAGVMAMPCAADVTDRAALETALARVESETGGIDILVNNAGIARTARFLEMAEDDWAQVLDVNLTAVWRVGQLVARGMAARGRGGAIVNIASILGEMSQPTQANYGASKAAVLHLTRTMARELAAEGIRVNALLPGYFETEINAAFFASPSGERLVARLFPRRLGRPEELDGALLLLASKAGGFITGTTITVDGGTHLTGV